MAETVSRVSDSHIVIQTADEVKVIGRNVGVKGDPGAAGASSSSPGWNPCGEWESSTAYSPLDVVAHTTSASGDGSAYICIQANSNKAPATQPLYWALLVQTVAGPQGPGGDAMAAALVGVWRGAWAASISYNKHDLTRFESSTYVALSAHTSSSANSPSTGAGKWALFAQRGGVGPQGARGEAGERGLQGPIGQAGPAGVDGLDAPLGLSFGPITSAGTRGFLNRSGYSLRISEELKSGTGTVTRKLNGTTTSTLPLTIDNGDLFEITISGTISNLYVGYKALRL